jgi:hypothetical protein
MKLCRPFRLALARCFSRQFAVRFFHLMLNLRSSKYAASPPWRRWFLYRGTTNNCVYYRETNAGQRTIFLRAARAAGLGQAWQGLA